MPQGYSATALLRNLWGGLVPVRFAHSEKGGFAALTEKVLFASLTEREGT